MGNGEAGTATPTGSFTAPSSIGAPLSVVFVSFFVPSWAVEFTRGRRFYQLKNNCDQSTQNSNNLLLW